MSKFLLPALCAATFFCALGACARGKPKSTARMYGGDAPTIKYSEKHESAGGYINTY